MLSGAPAAAGATPDMPLLLAANNTTDTLGTVDADNMSARMLPGGGRGGRRLLGECARVWFVEGPAVSAAWLLDVAVLCCTR